MKINNQDLYLLANKIANDFNNIDKYIPAKANFYIQKNIQLIAAAGAEIDKSRLEVAKHYGVLDEEKQLYLIPPESMDKASKELEELFSIEQELDIKIISIEDLNGVEFTPAQMQAIMFMIEE